MEAGSESAASAPFLVKTYEMVDDSSTNEIVSWSTANNSFIVWDTADFCRLLLPTYFKHNNFSSFIRQLNTYGFRKRDPDRWEFANDDFLRGQKHLLSNIHRKKPVHSHSHPPSSPIDPERAALEEQKEKLSREKNAIESHIISFKRNQSAAKLHMEDLLHRLDGMEKRQNNLLSFFEKALQNPNVVLHVSSKISAAMESSAFNKKRRFPYVDSDSDDFIEDNHDVFHQNFSDKLKLEVASRNVSDVNLAAASPRKQSSIDEDWVSSFEMLFEGEPEGMLTGTNVPFTTEMLELADIESPKLQSLEPTSCEECDDSSIPCFHNLTLECSSLQDNGNSYSSVGSPKIDCQEFRELEESRLFPGNDMESGGVASLKSNNVANEVTNSVLSQQEVSSNSQGNPAPERSVNDEFWEKFFADY